MTINVIYPSEKANDKRYAYKLTKARSKAIKELNDGDTVRVLGYCEYEDVNAKGETHNILCIMDENGNTFSTISATFRNSFDDIVNIMDGEDFAITVVKGTSKAGRDFIDCELA